MADLLIAELSPSVWVFLYILPKTSLIEVFLCHWLSTTYNFFHNLFGKFKVFLYVCIVLKFKP